MVKLLLVTLLISFNCHAEWKVDIVNKDGNVMSQDKDTIEEINDYVAKTKHRWGREDGWYKKQCSDSLETRVIQNEGIGEEILEYHCPINYSAIISDITVEMDAKRAEKQAKKDDRVAIKASIQKVRDSDLPAWHKRFIIHQMKEMRD